VTRIDPAASSVVDRVTEQGGLGGVTIGFESVWLSDFAFKRVWRIRP
jgi:hypothetical protein